MHLSYHSEHMPRLTGAAMDEGFALDLCVAADTLFCGEEIDHSAVLTGLLVEQRSEPVVHTVLALLSRLLDRLGRGGGNQKGTAQATAELVMGSIWGSDVARAAELLEIVLADGDLSPQEAERGRHQAGTDLLILTQLTLGLASIVGVGEGGEPSSVLREVAGL